MHQTEVVAEPAKIVPDKSFLRWSLEDRQHRFERPAKGPVALGEDPRRMRPRKPDQSAPQVRRSRTHGVQVWRLFLWRLRQTLSFRARDLEMGILRHYE